MADNLKPAEYLGRKIRNLPGPILVLGGSGFVGANLVHAIAAVRDDVTGTATRLPAWRFEGLGRRHARAVNLLVNAKLDEILDEVRPRTVFDCVAHGAYSFETDSELIYQTNFNLIARLLERLGTAQIARYIHAGTSSEYGDNAAGPSEVDPPAPNSEYAVSKVAAANLLFFWGKKKRFPCCNLRLYSAYGPLEDASRLIPAVIRRGLEGGYPAFVDPAISRDFVYIDDVIEAFLDAALNLQEEDFGESFNIGSGNKTSISEVASIMKEMFAIEEPPMFTMPQRRWDVTDWYADARKAKERICWTPRTSFREGLARTVEWYRALPDKEAYQRRSKRFMAARERQQTEVRVTFLGS